MPPLTRFSLTFFLSSLGAADAGPVYLVIDSRGRRVYTDRLHLYFSHQQQIPYRIQTTDPRGAAAKTALTKLTYLDLITEPAERNSLAPALLIVIVRTESDFDANVVSRSGATGLMQLMPALAEQYGVLDPQDPAQHLDGESRYFKDLLTRFNGNTVLALSAYNASAMAIIAHEGMPSFQKPSSLSNEFWPYLKPTKYSNPCIMRFA